MTLFAATVARDLRLALRHPARAAAAPLFFVLAAVLFPLALGPDPVTLKLAAPGLLAVAALLAALLALDGLFRDDRNDGTLDLVILAPAPLALYAAGRIAAHWLLAGLPLLFAAPLMAVMLGMKLSMTGPVLSALLPATLLLHLLGAPGAALALGARGGSVLLALLIVPLYIPVLIFSASAIDLAINGISSWTSPVLFLWAMLALALPAAPLATAAILKGLNE